MLQSRRRAASGDCGALSRPVSGQGPSLEQTASAALSSLPELDVSGRLLLVRVLMRQHGLDAVLVSDRSRIRYFTGSALPAELLIISPDRMLAFAGGTREDGFARTGGNRLVLNAGSQADAVRAAAEFLEQGQIVGFDPAAITFEIHDRLMRSLPSGAELRESGDIVSEACEWRDETEAARVRAAAMILIGVLDAASGRIYDLPEAGLAAEIDGVLDVLGVRERPLRRQPPLIRTRVAYGPNSADIMHEPSAATLRKGEVAVVSAGAVVDGYWAVESRTLGSTRDPQVTAALSAVHRLSQGVRELAWSGAGLDRIFAAAMAGLRESGIAHLAPHGPCFSVGTGIGEPFGAAAQGATMTVCIQPGIYIPGKAGVRAGRTHCIKVNHDTEPDGIRLTAYESLAGTPAYYSRPFSADTRKSDGYTPILIAERPGSWEGGT